MTRQEHQEDRALIRQWVHRMKTECATNQPRVPGATDGTRGARVDDARAPQVGDDRHRGIEGCALQPPVNAPECLRPARKAGISERVKRHTGQQKGDIVEIEQASGERRFDESSQ